MKIVKSYLKDVKLIELNPVKDKRGSFLKIFQSLKFNKLNINFKMKECFISLSNKGVIRGMHYDILSVKNSKIIFCSKGKIFDVALDIRKNSPTYGKFIIIKLDQNDNKLIYIPYGFAHGFLSLKDATEVFYFSSANHNVKNERGFLWNSFGCKWPINKDKIILSIKDTKQKKFLKS